MKNLIQFKIAIIFLMVIIDSGCAITDSRLSGTWRSDLELTRKFNEEHVILTDKQKKFFSQLFGHMEITYLSPGKCEVFMPKNKIDNGSNIFEIDGFREIGEYKIIYKNENVIVFLEEDSSSGEQIRTLYFIDNSTYWVYIGDSQLYNAHLREYFTKVK